jgi:hypothetical protein
LKLILNPPRWECERYQCDNHCSHKGAAVYLSRFLSQRFTSALIYNLSFTRVHIADATRCQRDAGFLAGLKEAETGEPYGKKDEEAKRAGRIHREERERKKGARC